ncbi:MAG: EamA family transporter [Gammaproteobacteria bacterium]|nr:EamA family transporter [Gammaproteobacteria bacterium]
MLNGLLYLVTTVVWGCSWLAIEYQLGTVAPVVSVGYRFGLASLLLFAWCALRGQRLGFGARAHGRFLLLGGLLFCLVYQLSYHGQQFITSALAAISFSTLLWMNILNARLFFGSRAGKRVWCGSALGLAGIAMLFAPDLRQASLSGATITGVGFCLLGAFVASLGNMVSQKAQREGLPVLQSNAWGMLYGSACAAFIAGWQGEDWRLLMTPGYLWSLAYLVVFASIIGFGSYLKLLGRIGAQKAGYTMVMFPVVAVALSYGFEGMTLTREILVGGSLVLAGNLLVLLPGARDTSSCEVAPDAGNSVASVSR